jgi:hypothetical protein
MSIPDDRELWDMSQKLQRKHSHYYRRCPYPHIDVYRVLELFEVADPALQHIVKKALCAGQRGAKDFRKDLEEIVDTGNRRIEMLDEDTEERLRNEGRLK